MPKRIYSKGKGFRLINSKEDPVNRSRLGLLYDWRLVTTNKKLQLPQGDHQLAHQLPVALTRFLRVDRATLMSQIRDSQLHLKVIRDDRKIIKDELERLSDSKDWIREAEERIAKVQRTLTDAEHVVVKFAGKNEAPSATNIDGAWVERNIYYKVRVIKVSRTWWKDVYRRNLHIVQDKHTAYPLAVKPLEDKPRKDGTKLYTARWYEEREKGGPRVFDGFIATREALGAKQPFIAISEKKAGALMKLTSRIKRWESLQEARKTAQETPEVTYEIDETTFKTETALHEHLAKLMQFPDYFTNDYDSLSEMLGEIVVPTKIKWTARLFSPWLFIDCFRSAAEDNKQLKFEIVKYKECESEEIKLEDLV
jgi:RNAse (barnase) inhibitor barstar